MSTLITVRLDTSAFEAWTTKATAQLARNLRSAVNTSARTARRATIIAMAADSGVPASRFRKGTPTVSGATTGNLSARWTVSGKGTGNMLRPVGSTTVPTKIGHGKVYVGSTFRQTGGGSDPLSAKAFIVTGRNGNRLVVVRNGKGRGAFKPLYAEGPGTAMRQPNSVDALSGIQSYTAIQRDLGVLLDSPKVRGILLDLDTPGGEAAGGLDQGGARRETHMGAREHLGVLRRLLDRLGVLAHRGGPHVVGRQHRPGDDAHRRVEGDGHPAMPDFTQGGMPRTGPALSLERPCGRPARARGGRTAARSAERERERGRGRGRSGHRDR